MARIARPSSDIRTTGWAPSTGTQFWQLLATHPVNNVDTLGSPLDPTTADYCELGLGAITDPGTSDKHYLRVGVGKSNANRTMNAEFRLMQGATQIATRTVSPINTGVPRYFCWELTAAETDAITDYGGLSVRCIPAFSAGVASTRAQWFYCEFYAAEPVASRVQSTDSDAFAGTSVGPDWDLQVVRDGSGASQVVIAYPAVSSGNLGASNTTELAVAYWVKRDFIADQQYSEATIRTPYTDTDSRQSVFVFWTDNPDYGLTNYRVDFQWASPNWEIKLTGNGVGTGTVLGTTAGAAPQAGDVMRLEGRWNTTLSRMDYTGTLKRGGTTITTVTAFDATGSRVGRPGMTLRSLTSGATSFADWNGGAIDPAPALAIRSRRRVAAIARARLRA